MALLAELRNEGLILRAAGEQLFVEPRASLTESLRSTIRANKAVILAELADEAVRDREARRDKVESQLRANPKLRRAFDVADEPSSAGPGESVSVVLAVRHGDEILSGEVLLPHERWDLKKFLAVMESPERPQ
jgi:hypothetical protein